MACLLSVFIVAGKDTFLLGSVLSCTSTHNYFIDFEKPVILKIDLLHNLLSFSRQSVCFLHL